MAWFLVSLVLFAVALISLHLGKISQPQQLQAAECVTIEELIRLWKAVTHELGPGAFSQTVQVSGNIVCNQPLISELSQTPCVWYKLKITGQKSSIWSLRPRTVAVRELRVPFDLTSDGHALKVLPERAVFSAEHTVRYLRMGSEVYLHDEECLPVGSEVTMVAEAADPQGQLVALGPKGLNRPFWIRQAGVVQPSAFVKTDRFFVVTSVTLTVVGIICGILGVLR